VGHFVLRPITLEILNRPLQNFAQIKLTSFQTPRVRLYLNHFWKIVALSSEWQ